MPSSIFSDLKTLANLRKLDETSKKLLPGIEDHIDRDGAQSILDLCLEKLPLSGLFQLSESSEKIRKLFETKQCEAKWKEILAILHCNVKPNTNASIFQQLMGSYLAFYYHQWVKKGYGNAPKANELLNEIEKRGIQNPCRPEDYLRIPLASYGLASLGT